MAKKSAVKTFNIIENDGDGLYYVTLHYTWRAELIHLSTRRVKTEPKMWKSLDRLIAHIKTKFPSIKKINLTLKDQAQQTLSIGSKAVKTAAGKTAKKTAKKKA